MQHTCVYGHPCIRSPLYTVTPVYGHPCIQHISKDSVYRILYNWIMEYTRYTQGMHNTFTTLLFLTWHAQIKLLISFAEPISACHCNNWKWKQWYIMNEITIYYICFYTVSSFKWCIFVFFVSQHTPVNKLEKCLMLRCIQWDIWFVLYFMWTGHKSNVFLWNRGGKTHWRSLNVVQFVSICCHVKKLNWTPSLHYTNRIKVFSGIEVQCRLLRCIIINSKLRCIIINSKLWMCILIFYVSGRMGTYKLWVEGEGICASCHSPLTRTWSSYPHYKYINIDNDWYVRWLITAITSRTKILIYAN